MHPSTSRVSRPHGQHRLHEKSSSAFVADLSHAADLVLMGEIDVGRILHQQHDGRGHGLFSGLLQVRLHQGSKGDLGLMQQPIQGFTLFSRLHLSWQRAQGILRQLAGRLGRSSRATQIMQLHTPKGSLGPALGVQSFLCLHPSILSFCKMWVRIRLGAMGSRHLSNLAYRCLHPLPRRLLRDHHKIRSDNDCLRLHNSKGVRL